MSATLTTRVFAGVRIPDTPLISKALEFARNHSTDFAFNHVQRSMLLGFIIAGRIPECRDRDLEVHAVSALLHDMGWDPTSELVSKDRRFEVDGADAAREFLRREAPGWDKHKLQLVWDSIALHTTSSIVFYKEPEVQACSYGIYADLQGPDHVANGLLSWDEYNAVVKELPRLDLLKELRTVMCNLCITKAATTYDNIVGDWGVKYVEGYSKAGKLGIDLVENSDLDTRNS